MDNKTQGIINALDRLGIADNTLIFFTADNGSSNKATTHTTPCAA